jgi:hypothetical protein
VSLTALRLFTGESKCLTQMKIFVPLGARLPLAGKVLPSGRICSSAGSAEDVAMSALKLAFLVSRIAYLMAALEVSIALQTCLCALVPDGYAW